MVRNGGLAALCYMSSHILWQRTSVAELEGVQELMSRVCPFSSGALDRGRRQNDASETGDGGRLKETGIIGNLHALGVRETAWMETAPWYSHGGAPGFQG